MDNNDQSKTPLNKELVQVKKGNEEIFELERNVKENELPPPSLDIFSNPVRSNENTYLEAATLSHSNNSAEWNVEVSRCNDQAAVEGNNYDISDNILGTIVMKPDSNILDDDTSQHLEIDNVEDVTSGAIKSRRGPLASFFSRNRGKKEKNEDNTQRKHKFKFFGGKKDRKKDKSSNTEFIVENIDKDGQQGSSKHGKVQIVPAQYKSDLLLMISEEELFEHRITVKAFNDEDDVSQKEEEEVVVESIEHLEEDLFEYDNINAVEEVLKDELKDESSDDSVNDTEGIQAELFHRKDANIYGTPLKVTKHDDDIVSSPESHQVPVVAVITEIPKRHSITSNSSILAFTEDEKVDSEVSSSNEFEEHSISSQDEEEPNESPAESDLNKEDGEGLSGIKGTIQQWERRSSHSDFSDGNISSEDSTKIKKKNNNVLDILGGDIPNVRKSSSSSDQSSRGRRTKTLVNQSNRSTPSRVVYDVNVTSSGVNQSILVDVFDGETETFDGSTIMNEIAYHSNGSMSSTENKNRRDSSSDLSDGNTSSGKESNKDISDEKDVEVTDDDIIRVSSDNSDNNFLEENQTDIIEEINAGDSFPYTEPSLPVTSTFREPRFQEDNINEDDPHSTSAENDSCDDTLLNGVRKSSTISDKSDNDSPSGKNKPTPTKPARNFAGNEHITASWDPKDTIIMQSGVDIPIQKQMAEVSTEAPKLSQKMTANGNKVMSSLFHYII